MGRGGCDGVDLGGVGYQDAALGSRLYVYVVHPDAGPAYGLEVLGPLDDLGRNLRRAADNEAVVLPYPLQQLLWREVQQYIYLELFFEEIYAALGELLAYEDLQILTSLFEKTRWAAPTPLPSSTGYSSDSSANSAAAIVAIMS